MLIRSERTKQCSVCLCNLLLVKLRNKSDSSYVNINHGCVRMNCHVTKNPSFLCDNKGKLSMCLFTTCQNGI
jgi:hypothetical protein